MVEPFTALKRAFKPFRNLREGRPALATFQVNLRCNSACEYCDLPLIMSDKKDRSLVILQDARNPWGLFLSPSRRCAVCVGVGRQAVVAARFAIDPRRPLSDRLSSHADYERHEGQAADSWCDRLERQDRSGYSDRPDHVDHPEKFDRFGSRRDR